ncbi:MAG: tetratricopeptide repeat protein [Pseudobdellovibrio sp.]
MKTTNKSSTSLSVLASLLLFVSFYSACSSKLIIQSDPSQADVFAQVEGKKDRVNLGQTPLEITEVQLNEKLNLSPDSVQWINLSLEKKDFSTREVMLPSSRWGETTKIVKLSMPSSLDKTTIVQEMLSYFFNAKKFAETKQFDQAHTEIDKILAMDAKNVRAINMKAGIYFLEGKIDLAKKYYRDALTIDPNSSDAIKMLERIQNQSGVN